MRSRYTVEELTAIHDALCSIRTALDSSTLPGIDTQRGLCGNLYKKLLCITSLPVARTSDCFMVDMFDMWPHSELIDEMHARCWPIPNNGEYGLYEGPNLAYRINAMEFAIKLCAAMLAAHELGEHNAVQER